MQVTNAGTVRPFEATVLVRVRGEASETGHLAIQYSDIEVVGGTLYSTDMPAGTLQFAEDAVKRLVKRGAGL